LNFRSPDDHLLIVDNPKNKKARSELLTGAGIPVDPVDDEITVPSHIHYGIERLRSSWEFTHAIGIYISGNI